MCTDNGTYSEYLLGVRLCSSLFQPDSCGIGHASREPIDLALKQIGSSFVSQSVSDPSLFFRAVVCLWSTGIPPFDRSDLTGNVVFIEIGARGRPRPWPRPLSIPPDPTDNSAAELLCWRPGRFGKSRSGWRIKA